MRGLAWRGILLRVASVGQNTFAILALLTRAATHTNRGGSPRRGKISSNLIKSWQLKLVCSVALRYACLYDMLNLILVIMTTLSNYDDILEVVQK